MRDGVCYNDPLCLHTLQDNDHRRCDAKDAIVRPAACVKGVRYTLKKDSLKYTPIYTRTRTYL